MRQRIILAVLLVAGFAAYAQDSAAPAPEKKYSVVGLITRPGNYTLDVPTTVLEALVKAGGFKDYANKDKIVIKRGETQFAYSYNEVVRGKSPEQNILLKPGDIIVVK